MRNNPTPAALPLRTAALTAALLGSALPALAVVKPNPLFSDNMVLQREANLPVWGTADNGEKVTVSVAGQTVRTVAKDGKWQVRLKPLKAGGPLTLTFVGEGAGGRNSTEVKNVLVGDVYLCSGQSNMEWRLSNAYQGAEAIAASKDPMLRLYTVPKRVSETPQTTLGGRWEESSPETTPAFSAVAYYFGRDLRKAKNIPIGLIHTSWGGTPAEAWTSKTVLESNPVFRSILERQAKAVADYPQAMERFKAAQEKYTKDMELAKAGVAPTPTAPRAPANPVNQNSPSTLYNGMVAPLVPFAVKGAIWYQGESNAGRAMEYRTLFPAMIQNWRSDFGSNFPFLFVQIAPYNGMGPEIREAQLYTLQTVPNTAMAVITDYGEAADIHPKKKEPVGARLALAARALAYGEKITYSGPLFEKMQVMNGKAVLHFKSVGGGLKAEGGDLTGFTIAGEDGKFVEAKAVITGKDTVEVSSPMVTKPTAVRYGWSNVPVVNLYNQEGLPASPFRTDMPRTTTASN